MIKYYKYILFFFSTFLINEIYSKELKIAVLKFGSVNWELDVLSTSWFR